MCWKQRSSDTGKFLRPIHATVGITSFVIDALTKSLVPLAIELAVNMRTLRPWNFHSTIVMRANQCPYALPL